MERPFDDFAMDELLTHLIEECAEIVQACTKLRRFGAEATDPRDAESPPNRVALAREVGNLLFTLQALDALDDHFLSQEEIDKGRARKLLKLQQYLRHSKVEMDGDLVVVRRVDRRLP